VDLTEPSGDAGLRELPAFSTPSGRRIEYLARAECGTTISVPYDARDQWRAVAGLRWTRPLAADHVRLPACPRRQSVAVCDGGRLRGCASPPVLTRRSARTRLQVLWRQSEQSANWRSCRRRRATGGVIRAHLVSPDARCNAASGAGRGRAFDVRPSLADRVRGALLGLAVGDAAGEGHALKRPRRVAGQTAHVAGLCLRKACSSSDTCTVQRRWSATLRWQHEGYCPRASRRRRPTSRVRSHLPVARTADGRARTISRRLGRARACARGQCRDSQQCDPAAAIALASESAPSTTHQSPSARRPAATWPHLFLGALVRREPKAVLGGLYEPVAACGRARPLRPEIVAAASVPQTRR